MGYSISDFLRRREFTKVLLAALFVIFPGLLCAQITGTLTGTVYDATGAVILGAKVTLSNTATNDTRSLTTNHAGYFAFAAVPPAEYVIKVESAGFKVLERSGIAMNPGDRRNLSDLVLEIGASSDKITIVATPEEIVPLDSGEKSAVLTAKDIANLSVMGRNASELIKVLPGMAMTSNGLQNRSSYNPSQVNMWSSPLGAYTANGTETQAMMMESDGANLVDPGCNCATTQNVNTDMVAEVKVQTSNFSAENAKGPVRFSAVGKSGTSAFHGGAYMYARNSAMNSTDYYVGTNQHLPKADEKYYYPGGQISGPVLIPHTNFNKNRDKLFFFAAFEYYYQMVPGNVRKGWTPSDQMKKGDFSESALTAAFGPNRPGALQTVPTNLPGVGAITNGQIPASLFDAGGKVMMNVLPQPNADPLTHSAYNFVKQFVNSGTSWQSRIKGDYSFSEKTKFSAAFNLQKNEHDTSDGIYWAPDWALPYPSPVYEQNTSKSWSGNLTHIFSAALTNEFVVAYTDYLNPAKLTQPEKAMRSNLGYPYQGAFKNSAPQIPNIEGGWSDGTPYLRMPGVAGDNMVNYGHKRSPTFSDNVMWVKGTHTIKGGVYYDFAGNEQSSYGLPQGTIKLGSSGISSGNNMADLLLGRPNGYSQDLKQAVADLTQQTLAFYINDSWKVTRRLTLELGARFEHLGPWSDISGVGKATWFANSYKPSATLADMTGVSWHGKDPSVPLSGLTPKSLWFSPRFGIAYDVFGSSKTVVRGGWGRYHYDYNQHGGVVSVPLGNRTWNSPTAQMLSAYDQAIVGPAEASLTSVNAIDPTNKQLPTTDSYSFTISQRLPLKSILELSYVGSQSRDLYLTGKLANVNKTPAGALFKDPSPQNANVDSYRPYLLYQDINLITHGSYSNFNSFQASWNRKTGRFASMLNYTFGKSLGIRNDTNPYDMNANYGIMGNDRRHIFNATYVFDVPGLTKGNALLKGVTNGWQISGITQWQSGVNLQTGSSSNFGLQGTIDDGSANGKQLDSKVWLGTSFENIQPVLTCNPTSNLRPNQYINPNCFAIPAVGTQGSIIFPDMRGPAFFNSDLSVFKNFTLTETRKIQFRFNAYNFLNHPLDSFESSNTLTLNFNKGVLNSPNFGMPTIKYGQRVIQVAVKFDF